MRFVRPGRTRIDPKALVETSDATPKRTRNEQVVGSIPTGGSALTRQNWSPRDTAYDTKRWMWCHGELIRCPVAHSRRDRCSAPRGSLQVGVLSVSGKRHDLVEVAAIARL
jgi:hypothetical protein